MVGAPLCWMTRSFKSVNRLLFTSLILLSISGVFPVLTNILVIGIFHIGCLNSNTYVSGSLCYYDLTLTNTSMYYHKSYMKFFSTLHNSIETQSLYVWTYRYYGIFYLQYLKSRPIFMRGCKTEIQKILLFCTFALCILYYMWVSWVLHPSTHCFVSVLFIHAGLPTIYMFTVAL